MVKLNSLNVMWNMYKYIDYIDMVKLFAKTHKNPEIIKAHKYERRFWWRAAENQNVSIA